MDDVTRRSGVWSTRQLIDEGIGPHEVRRALRAGRLVRLRRGWYAEPGANGEVVRAVRAGGVLACASALARYGVWVPPRPDVHVRAARRGRVRVQPGVRWCPAAGGPHRAPTSAVDPLPMAVQSAWLCLDDEAFGVVADSVLNLQLMSRADLRSLLGPGERRDKVMARCGGGESGTETMVRLRLRARGIIVRPQVVIAGVGRVDLLVGERLVVEVDSVAHHTAADRYRADRARDLRLRAMGYIVVRLTYEQVMFDWPATEAALLAMIRRGDQWWGSRAGSRQAPAWDVLA